MNRALVAAVGVVVIGSGDAGAAPDREPDTLPVPPVPDAASSATVELPAVPSFELPSVEPGVHDVRELRVRGRALLGSELTVAGYIVWIYDCLAALAKPGMTIIELQERIDDNPGLCERPKFALGASPTASLEAALWVVDVPRPPNKRERIALSWDYAAQSLAVAQQAVRAIAPASPELWLELGMAHEAMRRDTDAIAAFSRAIDGGNLQARFQRGQVEVRKNDFASARRDLESFLATAGPSLAFARQIATGLLLEITRKQGLSQPYMRLPTRLDPRDAQRHQ